MVNVNKHRPAILPNTKTVWYVAVFVTMMQLYVKSVILGYIINVKVCPHLKFITMREVICHLQGRIQGGRTRRAPPLKLEKI